MKLRLLNLVLGIVFSSLTRAEATVSFFHFAPLCFAQAATTEGAKQQQSAIAKEEPLAQNAKERRARLAKNARYNSRGTDLTKRPPDESFIEQVWPRALPVIPVQESSMTLVGKVVRMQPYLSQDRSRIYTELTVQPDEIVKSENHLAATTLVIDTMGGTLRTQSGQVVNDAIMIDGLGQTHVGGRYVLFARRVHQGKDLTLVRGYEVRDGLVFKLNADGSAGDKLISSIPGAADIPSEEGPFLQAVRQRAGQQRMSTKSGGSSNGAGPPTQLTTTNVSH